MLWPFVSRSSARPPGNALISPVADFLTVGGISLFFAAYALLFMPADGAVGRAGMVAFYLAFFVNYPHFMYSYQLMYEGFWRKAATGPNPPLMKARYWFAGVFAPLAMLAYFLYYGAEGNANQLSYLVNAMLFLVGWHYVKQGFGVLVVLSAYKRIYFSRTERVVLLLNALFVWLAAWAEANSAFRIHDYYSVMYLTVGIPEWMSEAAWSGMIASSACTAAVFLRGLVTRRGRISWNGWTGYLAASYLWIYLVSIHYLYILFFPLFHSLQYLPFVFRYKLNQGRAVYRERRRALIISLSVFAVLGAGLGYLLFYQIPYWLNSHVVAHWRDNPEHGAMLALGPQIFTFAFVLFINVHHYFIDNVIWRKDNAETRRYLFGMPEEGSSGAAVTASPSAVISR